MNFPIKNIKQMSVTEVSLMLSDLVRFIHDATGQMFRVEEVHNDEHETRVDLKIGKAEIQLVHNNSIVNNCNILFDSPLHNKHKNKWLSVVDSGNLIDYVILHTCPNLMLLRNISYISKVLDNSAELEIVSVADIEHKLQIVVKSQRTKKKLYISFGTDLAIPTIKKSKLSAVQLKSFHQFDQDLALADNVEYIEHSFANISCESHCPHPCTVQNLHIIFNMLELRFVL